MTNMASILSYNTSAIEQWVLWFTFDTQAKKLITDKVFSEKKTAVSYWSRG